MMCYESLKNRFKCRSRSGIVLLVTLVLLVVLSTLGYLLSSQLFARRHRNRYMIDYQIACYGRDSAVKYSLARLQMVEPNLISRPNEPDFSDLFTLDDVEYQQLLAEWAAKSDFSDNETAYKRNKLRDVNDINNVNNANDFYSLDDVNDVNDINDVADYNEPRSVPGPYGPPWPLLVEPMEFEIGSANVRIEIEDENAKYPIGWMLLDDKKVEREAVAGFTSFCEWMDVNEAQIDSLKKQLKEINSIKQFKLEFKDVMLTERETTTASSRRRVGRRTRAARARETKRTVIPAAVHLADFAKLFHSSLIDTEALARPTIMSESRKESALKYMGIWGSSKVNINTAPRQVLEAAFTFGGDAEKIAEEIIRLRRLEPFKNVEELRQSLLRYSDSIKKCEEYIITTSTFFTIKVTAVSGMAKASAVIAVKREGKQIKPIAVIFG